MFPLAPHVQNPDPHYQHPTPQYVSYTFEIKKKNHVSHGKQKFV